eukprot:5446308-Alexandrium_andersonii.AAC.1
MQTCECSTAAPTDRIDASRNQLKFIGAWLRGKTHVLAPTCWRTLEIMDNERMGSMWKNSRMRMGQGCEDERDWRSEANTPQG